MMQEIDYLLSANILDSRAILLFSYIIKEKSDTALF